MPSERRLRLRPLLRALHRDVGYLLVGLTFVYALSGLAVNHIADWDPNFHNVTRTAPLPASAPPLGDDVLPTARPEGRALAARALLALGLDEPPEDLFAIDGQTLEVYLPGATVYADARAMRATLDRREPRVILRAANWLHLNRGKKGWTRVADLYAVLLLFLATSGMFMLPGRRGLRGRGAILVAAGVAVPILYVLGSGGPNRHEDAGATPPPEALGPAPGANGLGELTEP